MVFMSAVMPAPEDGSKPAMVNTVGGASGITQLYPKSDEGEIRRIRAGNSRQAAENRGLGEFPRKLLKTLLRKYCTGAMGAWVFTN
jgi:hypothetical protein